jgi:DNA-binding transcriptional LysR family regulator
MITRTGTIEDLIALVCERVMKLACVLASGPLPGLTSEVLAHMPLLLVVANDHRWHAARGFPQPTLEDLTFIPACAAPDTWVW